MWPKRRPGDQSKPDEVARQPSSGGEPPRLEREPRSVAILTSGVVDGMAGGLLRDVVVRDVPSLLRPGQFITPMLVLACGLYLLLTKYYGVSSRQAAWITVGVFFLLRVLAVTFKLRTRPILHEPDA